MDSSPISATDSRSVVGDLELDLNSHRAFWRCKQVNLTLAEFRIARLLVTSHDRDVSHRAIYDIARGAGFMAGRGENGYRANVRTFIKRIRQKFGEVDDAFDQIATYSGFGYRWLPQQEAAATSEKQSEPIV